MNWLVVLVVVLSALCLDGIQGQLCETNATVHVYTHFRIEEPSSVNFNTKQVAQIVRYNTYWNATEVMAACPGLTSALDFPIQLVFLNAVDMKALANFPTYSDQVRISTSQPSEEFIFQVFQGAVFLDVSIRLQEFPFDDQYLPMFMYLFFSGSVDDDLHLLWNVTVNDETPGIPAIKTEEPYVFNHVYNPNTERSSLEYFGLQCGPVGGAEEGEENLQRTRACAWRTKRIPNRYMYGYFIPIPLFVLLAIMSFAIPFKQAIPRFSVSAFVLLLMGQYRNTVADLTSASSTQSWLDILMTFCFVLGFIAMFGQCVSWIYFDERGERVRSARVDRFMQWILLFFFLLGIVISCVVSLNVTVAEQIVISVLSVILFVGSVYIVFRRLLLTQPKTAGEGNMVIG